MQKVIEDKFIRLFSFKRYSKTFLISCFLISFFIVDLSKADSNNSTADKKAEIAIDNLDPRRALEEDNLNSKNIEPIFEKENNRSKLGIDYLDPKNELEDYIVDTGDSLLIQFKNKPRGIGLIDSEYDPQKISYLNPRNDLRNYKLDESDVLDIKFLYVPEFNSTQRIDQEGEIYLPELGSVYVKGLNIYQAKDLLEKKYEKYLKLTDMEIRINQFRFMSSGIYSINNEGELMLPLLKETYVRGLTTNEISNLLSKKYLNSEYISSEVEIRIANFKPQRILITGEIRNPGIYKFASYSSGEFLAVENIKDNTSQKREMENDTEDSISLEIDGENTTEGQLNSRESKLSSNQNAQNNTTRQSFQIKRPSENFTTISNAIRQAGGVTSKTDLSRIEIIRDIPIGKGGGKQRAVIDFTSFLNKSDPTNDIRLFDGDRIFIPKLATASSDIIPKSILSGLSPRFITVDIFGRVENPGTVKLPLEAALSDAINLTGPIRPLSGKIVLIRYDKDGTVIKKNISYSASAKKGSKRNPFVKQGDLISVKNSLIGKSTGIIRDIPLGKGGGKKRAIIDFTSFVENSDPTNDIRLFDGDRIFIPKRESASSDIVPKSILSGLSPRFITVNILGRVENPGPVSLPLEAALSDAIDLTGPIRPLSGKIVLIRYNRDGTILKKNISYSARAKRGSRRNPFVKQGDLISVKNSILGKTTGVIREFTAPFIGIYSTKEILESFD